MSDRSLSPRDMVLLRDILDLTRPDHAETPRERTFQLLVHLEALIGCEQPTLQEMDSVHRTRTYCQGYDDDGGRWIETPQEAAAGDEEPWMEEFWRQWWGSMCSLPERVDRPVVVAERSIYSLRELLSNPLHEHQPWVDEALVGYPSTPGRSVRLIMRRDAGSAYGPRELTLLNVLLPHLQGLVLSTVSSTPLIARLTGRQAEILRHVAQGKTNRETGRDLGISEATVRKHLEHSYQKLGVLSRTAAVTAL